MGAVFAFLLTQRFYPLPVLKPIRDFHALEVNTIFSSTTTANTSVEWVEVSISVGNIVATMFTFQNNKRRQIKHSM